MGSEEFQALIVMGAKKDKLNDRFLQLIVQHLAFVYPEFGGQVLLETLYLQMEGLPSPGQDPDAANLLLYWKHKIELTEKALKDAETMRTLLAQKLEP